MRPILPDTLPSVLIAFFPTSAWQSNCYLVGPDEGSACIVIDPGPDAAPTVDKLLADRGRTLAGILLTHGHVDHVADAHILAATHQVPVWIHPADEGLLTDPAAGLGEGSASMLTNLIGTATLPKAADVRHLPDAGTVEVAGLVVTTRNAPGHTPGCTLLLVEDERDGRICFSGDVLFYGSIGRTDLPGGDHATMLTSLKDQVATLDHDTMVLPGHGPRTTIGQELASNPYLRGIE